MAKWKELPADVVNHPPQYNSGGIESYVEPHHAYCWQNAFKYIWRWPYKNGVEDLRKARWYIDRLIHELENES